MGISFQGTWGIKLRCRRSYVIVMRRHIWTRGAIGGGWLHQTRPVGKSTWSFLPTGLHPGTLKLATERVCPRGDTQFTLGSLSIYCLMILSVLGLCCCGGVSGCVSGAAPSLRCLGVCSTGLSVAGSRTCPQSLRLTVSVAPRHMGSPRITD